MHKCILYVRFMKDKKNIPKLVLVVTVVWSFAADDG